MFIPQAEFEGWVERGEAIFDNDVLTMVESQHRYSLVPGARVRSVIEGNDRLQLVGRVFTVSELAAMHAEHYAGSIILGDIGYECEEGYVGASQHADANVDATTSACATEVSVPTPVPTTETDKTDSELLADFLLKNL